MHYIVLDLEWNQPLSYSSPAYKSVGGKLLFEMIQIGAVRVNEQMQVVDSFSQFISPKHYVELHPRIARITHITQEELEGADDFQTVVSNFAQWCGNDYVLLSWGPDDSSVLSHNMEFFKCSVPLAPVYDIQRRYGEVTGQTKNRAGLKTAMEQLEIVPDDSMPFHNALNDAYYTALVFAALGDPQKVLAHPVTARKLAHIDRSKRENQSVYKVRSCTDALRSPMAVRPPCPVCNRKTELAQGYLLQRGGFYMGLGVCPEHGLYFSKLEFSRNEENRWIMTRSTKLSEEQSDAYVHTKLLQWQNKLAAQSAENN